MVDAVLLEWEGVFADTSVARRDALIAALREESVHFDPSRFDECCDELDVTSAASAAIGLAGRDDAVLTDLVAMRARRAFAERLGKGITLVPGAVAFAERMCVSTRTAIVTSSSRSEAEFVIRLAGLDAVISTIISSDDVAEGSPSAAGYRRALAQLDQVRPVRPNHVIAIVSGQRGIRAARAAGVRTLAVDVPAHVAVEADGLIDSLATLTVDELARAAGIESVERRP